MLYPVHPGPWPFFVQRRDNQGLSIHEIQRKYLLEEYFYFSYVGGSHLTEAQRQMLTETGQVLLTELGQELIL